jgi:hypothetical protein
LHPIDQEYRDFEIIEDVVKVRGSSNVVLKHKVSRNGIVFDGSILDTDANDINMWTPREVFPP